MQQDFALSYSSVINCSYQLRCYLCGFSTFIIIDQYATTRLCGGPQLKQYFQVATAVLHLLFLRYQRASWSA